MAYLVLARKYRPQTLAEVIGQDAIVRTLKNAITLGRLHHAYLFTGARGVGKTSIARILAKSLNCEKGPTDTPCGVCAPCTEIARSSSPDVLEIDGASNTSVDNVRELRETVKYLPSRGKYKLYIIDEVHMLSQSAFNALLKTLEEPPEHVMFVFATTEPHKIPITILSRCQRFDFRRVPMPVLQERLQQVVGSEGLNYDSASLAIVAQAADGSVRDAMSLLDQVIAFAGNETTPAKTREALGLLDREKVRGLLHAILSRQPAEVTALVQSAYAQAADLSEIGERLVEAIRDLTVVKLSGGQAALTAALLPDELQALQTLAEPLSPADLHRLFALLSKTVEETSKSTFPHLTFEMGLLQACDLEPVRALGELLAELRGNSPPPGDRGPSGGGNQRPPPPPTPVAAPASKPSQATAPVAPTPQVPAQVAPPVRATPTQVTPAAPPPPESSPERPTERPTDFAAFTRLAIASKPRIGTALEHVVCPSFTAGHLALVAPPGEEVFADMLNEPDTLKWLNDFASKAFGRATEISVTRGQGEPTATIANQRQEERRSEVHSLKKNAAAHPAVQQVLGTLGGDVSRVEVSSALSRPADEYD